MMREQCGSVQAKWKPAWEGPPRPGQQRESLSQAPLGRKGGLQGLQTSAWAPTDFLWVP